MLASSSYPNLAANGEQFVVATASTLSTTQAFNGYLLALVASKGATSGQRFSSIGQVGGRVYLHGGEIFPELAHVPISGASKALKGDYDLQRGRLLEGG